MTRQADGRTSLSGDEVRQMLAQAADWLQRNAGAIDAINVFPVPDGDTGSNMALTLNAAVEAAATARETASDVLTAMARGALLGARGNSGVLLSQIFSGLATGIADAGRLDAPTLAAGLRSAVATAYRAVSNPVEGTILTVLSDVSTEVNRLAHPRLPLGQLLDAADAAARASVARTPELLPILREADVVDSGGLGLSIIVEGCLLYVRGEQLPAQAPSQAVDSDRFNVNELAHGLAAFGYCTEFLIEGQGLDPEVIRGRFERLGDSVLVVGEANLVHVHVHAADPGPALSLGAGLGSLLKVKVENMDAQHHALRKTAEPVATAAVSVVAVALGEGLEEVLRGYGASVVSGGQTMNPSTEAILRAIEGAPGAAVIVLPNNKNVILTANQAAGLAHSSVEVVPTTSVPQGIAALLAFRSEASLEENASAMAAAGAEVRTIEITRAARPVTIHGRKLREGSPIGLIEGTIEIAGESPSAVALDAIAKTLTPAGSAITIYYGGDLPPAVAEALGVEVERRWPVLEVQVISGGQPFYDFIISVE